MLVTAAGCVRGAIAPAVGTARRLELTTALPQTKRVVRDAIDRCSVSVPVGELCVSWSAPRIDAVVPVVPAVVIAPRARASTAITAVPPADPRVGREHVRVAVPVADVGHGDVVRRQGLGARVQAIIHGIVLGRR